MDIKLHKQATTTPKIRAEIQAAPSSITDSKLARQYGVATTTIRRWRYRDDVHDRSHTRHNLLATLTVRAGGGADRRSRIPAPLLNFAFNFR